MKWMIVAGLLASLALHHLAYGQERCMTILGARACISTSVGSMEP